MQSLDHQLFRRATRNYDRLHIIGLCQAPLTDGWHVDPAMLAPWIVEDPRMCCHCHAEHVQTELRK